MTETSKLTVPEAAQRLKISVRVLRQAIRSGKIPAPEGAAVTAVSVLPAAWLAEVQQKVKASPDALNPADRQKTPAFARYAGTSAWRKYHRRVRAYNAFRAIAA